MIDQASAALETRVPLEKRDAVAKEIQAIRKYRSQIDQFGRVVVICRQRSLTEAGGAAKTIEQADGHSYLQMEEPKQLQTLGAGPQAMR